ncbi:MAG: MOSC domain-containing protein [Bacillota bacterium]|nr:MOSC domain-containing protein [Bacillota bacterium]
MAQGKVYELKVSEGKGKAKKSLESIALIKSEGIKGDIHKGDTDRQVSFFTYEGIERIKASDMKGLCTGKFWGNITTKGLEFSKLLPGDKLKIGQTIIEITEKGKECYKACELFQNGLKCTIPMETAFGKILEGGQVNIEDKIEIMNNND